MSDHDAPWRPDTMVFVGPMSPGLLLELMSDSDTLIIPAALDTDVEVRPWPEEN